MRQSRLSAFFRLHKKDVIGFGVYYGIVGAAVAAGALLGWNLTLPMLLLLVVVLFCCMGGRNYIGEWQIYQDNPMAATEYDQGSRDYRALPLVRSLLLLLPAAAYFFVRLLLLLISLSRTSQCGGASSGSAPAFLLFTFSPARRRPAGPGSWRSRPARCRTA